MLWKITKTLELERNFKKILEEHKQDNENFRVRKRIVFQPAGGHRWTDLFIGGHSGNSSMPAALNQRGQLYWTGYDGGSSATYQHDYYGEGANSNQESYFFHLGPRD